MIPPGAAGRRHHHTPLSLADDCSLLHNGRTRPGANLPCVCEAMTDDLVQKMLAGDTVALSRLISRVERGEPDVADIMEHIRPYTGRAFAIGITGPPGSGKSTLVDSITKHVRGLGQTIAVLAVDPSSPFSGGALLGDRLRMRQHYTDPGVFIRSMASRGALGGLSLVAKRVAKLLDASGKDVVLLETVGVGQTEMAVMDTVETVVVVVVPESGDAIQTLKAGLLEAADIFVVNKADRPGAHRMTSDLQMAVMMGPQDTGWTIPVLETQAMRDMGVPELWDAIVAHRNYLVETGRLEELRRRHRKKEFFEELEAELVRRLHSRVQHDPRIAYMVAKVENGEADAYYMAHLALSNPDLLRAWFSPPTVDEPS